MSDAAPAAAAEAPPKKSKKKLIIIVAAVLLLGGGGGGAFFYMKQKAAAAAAAAAAEDGDEAPVAHAKAKAKDAPAKPTYVPLDAFVVNLADKETDRFAQIGITLQVDDSKVADDMKTYMPSLRNGILMILAHKSSEELLRRDGKEQLAAEVMRAAALALGIELEDEDADESQGKSAKKVSQDEDDEDTPKKPKKKKKKKKPVHNPITHVHFSNFIIQ
jgi:flagellar protein FliL